MEAQARNCQSAPRMSKKKVGRKGRIKSVISHGFDKTSIGARAEEVAKLVLRRAMAEKKVQIRRRAFAGSDNPIISVPANRFAKDRARALKKELVGPYRRKINPEHLLRERTPSLLLDSLDPSRPANWKKILARRYRRQFLRVSLTKFNFLDHPADAMQQLINLSKAEQEEVSAYLDFDDPYCEDIGAFLVMAEILPQLSQIFLGGRMGPSVQKVLDAVGLGRELKIQLHAVSDHNDVWPFEIRRRRTRGTTTSEFAQLQPQGREQLNDRLVELMDRWLAVASDNVEAGEDKLVWELSGDGRANIANMVGEILDNAERHSSGDGDGDWSMAAFMAKREREDGPPQMKCYLGFLSVGRSIAETIENAPAQMKGFCDAYATAHARPGQSFPTLTTIAALQDGITSVHDAAMSRRGGTGLQDTLGFVGDLGGAPQPNADVRVTIVSGKSCIRLRHPVLVGRPDKNQRRVQWCNAMNDPLYPPDREIAFDLPAHFAGTLVSVAFTLDPSLFVPEEQENG